MKKQKYKKYKQIDNLYVINNNLTKVSHKNSLQGILLCGE